MQLTLLVNMALALYVLATWTISIFLSSGLYILIRRKFGWTVRESINKSNLFSDGIGGFALSYSFFLFTGTSSPTLIDFVLSLSILVVLTRLSAIRTSKIESKNK